MLVTALGLQESVCSLQTYTIQTWIVHSISCNIVNDWAIDDCKNTSIDPNGMQNVYFQKSDNNKLMAEAELFFGQMREATKEEMLSVNQYVESISKETGVDFFDLC